MFRLVFGRRIRPRCEFERRLRYRIHLQHAASGRLLWGLAVIASHTMTLRYVPRGTEEQRRLSLQSRYRHVPLWVVSVGLLVATLGPRAVAEELILVSVTCVDVNDGFMNG